MNEMRRNESSICSSERLVNNHKLFSTALNRLTNQKLSKNWPSKNPDKPEIIFLIRG